MAWIKDCRFCNLLFEAQKSNNDNITAACEAALVVQRYYYGRYAGRDMYSGIELNFCPVCGRRIKLEGDNDAAN